MLRTNNLKYQYAESEELVFSDFSVNTAENLCIVGPSGSGKTTLLYLLTGLAKPKSGEIWFDDLAISDFSKAKLTQFRGENIGLIFQENYLINTLSVLDNLSYAAHFSGKPFDSAYALSVLEGLNLIHKKEAKPNELSLGERQRAAIARALINKPAYVFADEPSSSLDDKNCDAVIDLLQKTTANVNASLIIVTHDQRVKSHFTHKLEL